MKRRHIFGIVAVLLALLALLWSGSDRPPVEVSPDSKSVAGSTVSFRTARLEASTSVKLLRDGWTSELEVQWPVLPDSCPLFVHANQILSAAAWKHYDRFRLDERRTWRDYWTVLKERETTIWFDRHYRGDWRVTFASSNLVSLVLEESAPGAAFYSPPSLATRNFQVVDGKVRSVLQQEIFDLHGVWSTEIVRTAEREFNRRIQALFGKHLRGDCLETLNADQVAAADMAFDMDGLQLVFVSDCMGGALVVHLPYDDVSHVLITNGPARWLPCFQTPP